MEPSIACAKAGVTTGEWGAHAAQRVRRVPRADRRRAGGRGARRRRRSTSVRAEVERAVGQARPAHQVPRRQAGPRRPLQRRRADRRARARLRHGGRLRGHPPDAGADRARRGRRKRRTSSGSRSCRAATCRSCARSWSACARKASATCPSSSAASSRPRTQRTLKAFGVAAVYTPKNFQLNDIMADIVKPGVGAKSMAA